MRRLLRWWKERQARLAAERMHERAIIWKRVLSMLEPRDEPR